MNILRSILLSAFCLASVSAQAAPTASEQVRQHLSDALHGQIKQLMTASFSKRPPPTGAPTAEQLNQQADALLQQALVRFGPQFTLPEQTAQPLISKGSNDADNLAAMKRNLETFKKVSLPLPTLVQHLHQQVEAGTISTGWDLELARRVSDTHLAEATEAQRGDAESRKKNP
jgi:hypothetical protein